MELHWIGLDKTRDSNLSPASFDGIKWVGIGGDRASRSAGSYVSTSSLADNVMIELSKVAISVAGLAPPYIGPISSVATVGSTAITIHDARPEGKRLV
jgi:hypothetical protein